MATVRQPLPDEFEMDADGRIRDTETGEVFGHVPIGLRSLYNAASDLLAACEAMLKANYMPNSSMDIAVRAQNAIAKARSGA